jgi:putative aldouronate transport system substrate-binding protein
MYVNKENYTFALSGVEGVDYEVLEDGTKQSLTSDSFFYSWQLATLKYQDFSMYDQAEIEEYMHFDDDAVITKTCGFIFDNTSVKNEEAVLNAIIDEKARKIAYGLGDYDEEFPAILKEMKDNGLDKYIEEYQRQFSEFMASK